MPTSTTKKSARIGNAFAVLALAAGLQAMPAAAATYDAGNLSTTPYVNNATIRPGTFLDIYNFSVVNAGHDTTSAAVTLTLDWGNIQLLHISDLSMSLYNTTTSANLGTWTGNTPSFSQTLSLGDYHVDVGGTADGLGGGNYTFSIAAVPEPESYAMFLAGLGIVGLMVRRRKA